MNYLPKSISTTAYSNYLIIKNSGGVLYNIIGYNSSDNDQFIQIFDSSSLPTDGSIPVIIFKILSQCNFSFDLGAVGRLFRDGIIICNSSTATTKTIGASDCWIDAQYL